MYRNRSQLQDNSDTETVLNQQFNSVARERRDSVLIHPPAPPPQASPPPNITITQGTPVSSNDFENPVMNPNKVLPPFHNSQSLESWDQHQHQHQPQQGQDDFMISRVQTSNTVASQPLNLTRTNTTSHALPLAQPYPTHSTYAPYLTSSNATNTSSFDACSTYSHSLRRTATKNASHRARLSERRTSSTNVLDKLQDSVPSAKPNVDYQDVLWTQIDILDDVKRMSEQVNEAFHDSMQDKGNRNSDDAEGGEDVEGNNDDPRVNYWRRMRSLRDSQVRVISEMRKARKEVDLESSPRKIWSDKNIMDDYRREMNAKKGSAAGSSNGDGSGSSAGKKLFNREYFVKVSEALKGVEREMDGMSEALERLQESRKG